MEKEIKQRVVAALEGATQDHLMIKKMIIDMVFECHLSRPIDYEKRNALIESIYNSICGYDILTPFLKDEAVNEIMVNGYDTLFYEKNGQVFKSEKAFESEARLLHIIQTMVGRVNRVVNESSPIVDARLEDGSRINVVLPPASLSGPILTIRKFSKSFLKGSDLLKSDTLTKDALLFLKYLVRCRYNIFISGGTSSGKTTFLNLLSTFIPEDERIITIEDSAELKINTLENMVSLEAKNSNLEGKAAITIKDLIKTSLRMRPDRIIVGEVRGGEAFHMLTAMNTGHEGSLSTGHANSGEDMLTRLTTMVLTGNAIDFKVAIPLIRNTLDIVVHLSRIGGKRKVFSISELDKKDSQLKLKPLFKRDSQGKLLKVGRLTKKDKIYLYGGEHEQRYFKGDI